ncbi:MAG: cation:proton antiporter [Phycisphaerae bacterium]
MSSVLLVLEIGLAWVGGLFAFLAAVGIVVMPDLFTRMHAASKGATLGAACVLIAVALHFSDVLITVRAIVVAIFLFFTVPIAAHMIARAGYLARVHLAPGTVIDELQGRYDRRTHALSSPPAAECAGHESTPEAD